MDEESDELDFSRMKDNDELGYIYECNLEYPTELHDKHSDYPLAPEWISVKPETLSDKEVNMFACFL